MAWEPRPFEGEASAAGMEHLVEVLAANAHAVWGRKRISEGWTHGVARDAEQKTSPLLVPYEQLPDSEKETDRAMARGTIAAALAFGCVVEPPPEELGKSETEAVQAWADLLYSRLQEATELGGNPRAGDFDLDDEQELGSLELGSYPVLRAALQAFQESLLPQWRIVDRRAAALQRAHRSIARWSIWPGIGAIVLAVLQLAVHSNHTAVLCFLILEVVCAGVATTCVVIGHKNQTRDRWLTARQAAERMRILKFRSLADERLWSNPSEWREGWQQELASLAQLTPAQAQGWVLEGSAAPAVPEPGACGLAGGEVAALAAYYRVKRQRFQWIYFRTKAHQHQSESWHLRHKLPVKLFIASIVLVLLHSLVEATKLFGFDLARGWMVLAVVLLALGALLPVCGFGIRAWFSAFEIPRRAHLFHSKAKALELGQVSIERDQLHPRKTLTHIVLGEDLLENEHREWCRLILEAEWFV